MHCIDPANTVFYFSHRQTFFLFTDSNSQRCLPDAEFGTSVSRMTFYCLRNDRGRISMDFGSL